MHVCTALHVPFHTDHLNTHAFVAQRGRSRRNLLGKLEEEEETIWSTTIIPKTVYKLRATKRHEASNSPSKPQGIARDTLTGKLRRFKQGSVQKDALRKDRVTIRKDRVTITDKTTVKKNNRRRTGKNNRRRFDAATTIASLWYGYGYAYAKLPSTLKHAHTCTPPHTGYSFLPPRPSATQKYAIQCPFPPPPPPPVTPCPLPPSPINPLLSVSASPPPLLYLLHSPLPHAAHAAKARAPSTQEAATVVGGSLRRGRVRLGGGHECPGRVTWENEEVRGEDLSVNTS